MGLSYEEIPSIEAIAGDPEFEPAEVTKDEFEAVWTRATQS